MHFYRHAHDWEIKGSRIPMFVVYNCRTNRIIRATDNRLVIGLKVTNLDNSKMLLNFYEKSSIIINLNEIYWDKIVMCTTCTFCHKRHVEMLCCDCGPEAAEWISECLKDKDACLAFHMYNKFKENVPVWKIFRELRSAHRDEKFYNIELDESNFEYIKQCSNPVSHYKLMPRPYQQWIPYMLWNKDQTVPNIMFETSPLQDSTEWDLIMIGNTVLKNINPYPKLISNIDWRNISIEMLTAKLKLFPLHCNVLIPGTIEVGDKIFVKK
ncbi:uncharacterized protein LOC105181755 isoform X2 [Harpegnathos saltator]|uniref:uncharacterized protein LOC105181755 isoform X2 n=1 Tax=Harpegnathos saltator TaxID=610380 RepID=UPI00058E810E|nr:uncharacterized protein LOC105181755 isoform X2 [Harpegnathos saltator]